MRIFLTGGTGFLGSHFLKLALEAGHEVVALRFPGECCRQPLPVEPRWIDGDLESISADDLGAVDVLVHLAAHGVNPVHARWRDCFRWNVHASLDLWLTAADAGVRRFVIAGSCFEYGSTGESREFIPVDATLMPTGPYHSSKAAATMAALGLAVDRQLEVVVLRPFHIYGDGEAPDRFWPSLVRAALAGNDFEMTEGRQVRDFTKVEDVAACFLAAVTRDDVISGVPVVENIGSGHPRSLVEFAADEWARLGASGSLVPGAVPMRANEVMRYVPELPPSRR